MNVLHPNVKRREISKGIKIGVDDDDGLAEKDTSEEQEDQQQQQAVAAPVTPSSTPGKRLSANPEAVRSRNRMAAIMPVKKRLVEEEVNKRGLRAVRLQVHGEDSRQLRLGPQEGT